MVPVSRSAHGAHLPRRRPDRDGFPPSGGHGTSQGARGLRHVPGRAGRVDAQPRAAGRGPRDARRRGAHRTRTWTTADCCRCWSARGSGAGSGAPPRARSSPGWCCSNSARLQEEFAKRASRRERRDPERAAEREARDEQAFEEAVDLAAEGAASPGGPDPEELLRAAGPIVELGLDDPLYTEDDAGATLPMLRHIPYDAEHEVAQGVHVTLVDAGHILGSSIVRMRLTAPGAGRDTVIVFSGDLGRPGNADPARPHRRVRGRHRPVRVHLRRTRARGRRAGDRHAGRRGQRDRPQERRAAHPVVRDRADAGDRLGAGTARGGRADPEAAALPGLADGQGRVRHLPRPPGGVRRGDREAPARAPCAAGLPGAARRAERAGVREDRSARTRRT